MRAVRTSIELEERLSLSGSDVKIMLQSKNSRVSSFLSDSTGTRPFLRNSEMT